MAGQQGLYLSNLHHSKVIFEYPLRNTSQQDSQNGVQAKAHRQAH